MKTNRPKMVRAAALLAATALAVAACGSDNSSSGGAAATTAGGAATTAAATTAAGAATTGAATTGAATTGAATTAAGAATASSVAINPNSCLGKVYTQLNGLQGDARQQKLIELAKAAGGKATVYSADIEAVLTPLKAQFEKDTGISLETTRLTSVDILARISQEAQANHVAADAVLITDSDSYAADSLKLFEPLQTPVSADLLPGSMHGGWAAATATPFVAAWNTNNVKGADIPTDWKQVYENFQGRLGFEITDYTFFGGLVQYFMKTYNMTEDQAVQYFVDHAKGARVVSGHNTLMNLLNTGEFDMTAGQFSSVVDAAKANGAPGDWKPPVKPLFQINAGVGVLNNAPNCAAGLLYVEYRLQQGQKIAFDASKLAGTNPKYAPSVASNAGISDSDVVVIPKDILFDNRAHWKEQYQKVIDAAGH